MTAICAFIAVLLIIQIWLVSAALEALLSNDRAVLLPAALASFALFAINGGLLLHAVRFDDGLRKVAP
jgi:hypothetical protein